MRAGFLPTFKGNRSFLLLLLGALTILCIPAVPGTAQSGYRTNLGQLPIRNFPRATFGGGTQTWEIGQDSVGRLFFANNDGVFTFDGTHWHKHPLPKRTVVRSVYAAPDGKIYAGGQGELGYFEADKTGNLKFHSLSHLLPERFKYFEDVWDIIPFGGKLFIRTNKLVLCLNAGKIDVVESDAPMNFLGKVNDRLFLQKGNGTLYQLADSAFVPVSSFFEEKQMLITAMLPDEAGHTLVFTLKNGTFQLQDNQVSIWTTPFDDLLKNSRTYTACKLKDNRIAIGTTLSGIFILDSLRRIEHHLFKDIGLQNNTVLSLFTDRQGNLWAGLDNGISWVHTQSAFTKIFADGNLEGTGYTATAFQNNLYFGTNTGLYAIPRQEFYPPELKNSFTKVNNAEGQVWGLDVVGESLLAGLHEGAFVVDGYAAKRMPPLTGVWKFIELEPDLALAGHYAGLALFRKNGSNWVFDGMLSGMEESSRILVKDDEGRIWMSHPYRGVYRLVVNTADKTVDYFFYDETKGLPSRQNNYVFALAGNAFVATEKGVFRFQESQDRFIPDPQFKALFGENTWVKYLRQDDSGNIWYATDSETGLLRVDDLALDKKVKRVPIPELKSRMVGGFEFLFPMDEQNIFIATEEGFILFNPTLYKAAGVPSVILNRVQLQQSDSTLFGGWALPKMEKTTLSARQNALVFSWSSNDFVDRDFITYSFRLNGLNEEWSDWDPATTTVFNNLPPGEYTFEVKARNKHLVVSQPTTWSFEVLAPWYATTLAYSVYSLLLLGALAYLLYTQQRKFEKEKAILESKHQQREAQHLERVQQSQAEIEKLRNEKLQAEISHKNTELATTTMHLVQKGELMNKLRNNLQKISDKKNLDPEAKAEINRLIRIIDRDASLDEEWNRFSRHFDEVHSDFLQRLREKHPQLSPNDYKLCAYLRMNLSTKEIASLLNLSVRGVEASRYRLRKRLGLQTGENLIDFLLEI